MGVLGCAGAAVAVTALQPILTPQSQGGPARAGANVSFPKNANGQTYGSVDNDSPYLPDLVQVTGIGPAGKTVEGYVFQRDIEQPTPTSPAEAIRLNEQWKQQYPEGKTVKLYESNGQTVIGTWVEGQP